jgi:hypothetical protein
MGKEGEEEEGEHTQKLQNIPAQNSTYGTSLNAFQSTHGANFLGSSLTLNSTPATTSHPNTTNPIILTVHAKPILGNNSLIKTGNTTPPVQLPNAAKPTANALRRAKYVVTNAMAGQYINPCATPVQSACARNTCHHTVPHCAVEKIPTTCSAAPTAWMSRKWPLSSARPE